MAGGAASTGSRARMRTKIEAARIATLAGVYMAIADGRVVDPIARVAEGGGDLVLTLSNPITARKIWIGGSLDERLSVCRCRRCCSAWPRQEPAAGRGYSGRGRVHTRRLRRHPRRVGSMVVIVYDALHAGSGSEAAIRAISRASWGSRGARK